MNQMVDPVSAMNKTHEAAEKVRAKLGSGTRQEKILYSLTLLAAVLCVLGGAAYNSEKYKEFSYPTFLAAIGILLYVGYKTFWSSVVDLSKLKGASPFAEHEGDLLRKLGREIVVSALRDMITSGNVPVIFVVGPTGAGKTSVVNSGLRAALGSAREFIYADAGKGGLQESLLRQVRQLLKAGEAAPQGVEEIITAQEPQAQVVIIDNADLAADHAQLRHWVTLALNGQHPFKRVFILIFDEDGFRPDDWPSAGMVERVDVGRFERDEAFRVARLFCDQAGLIISDRLIRELIASLTMHPDSRVSPLALSVLIQFIGRKGVRFNIRKYRSLGYAAGIMAAHIRGRLSALAPAVADKVMAEMARLVGAGSRRISANDLRGTQMSDASITSLLSSLSSPYEHFLRPDRSRVNFKILDEWLAALSASLNQSTAFLEDYVEKKYEWWLTERAGRKPLSRLFGEGRYLLTRYELRQLKRDGSSPGFGGDQRLLGYIARSKNRRNLYSFVLTLLVLTSITASFFVYRSVKQRQRQALERGWGLPGDFSKYGGQIRELSVACMVDDLSVLPRRLKYLEANCERIKSLKGIPPGVTHLGISDTRVSSLAYLPASIEELDIHATTISGIDGLLKYDKLVTLDARGIPVTNMKLIPRSVSTLRLQHEDITRLEGLPVNLVEFEFLGTRVTSLKGVPDTIRRLTVVKNANLNIDNLPKRLEYLEAGNIPEGVAIPDSLDTVVFSSPGPSGEMYSLPKGIKNFEFKGYLVRSDFPSDVESLRFHDAFSSAIPLEKLPASLQNLKIRWSEKDLSLLSKRNLIELDISGSANIGSLKGVPRVSVLDISSTAVPNLREVPDSVTTLRFNLCKATSLTKFPENLKFLYLADCRQLSLIDKIPVGLEVLDIRGTAISALPKNLPSHLRMLDISDTQIRQLPKLPGKLEELILHSGQLTTLDGLPKSVKRLRFRQYAGPRE